MCGVQRPFTIDGVLGCGSGFEPGMAGVEKVPPWWVPVSFATATQLDITWQPLESCSSKEPIYTLQVGRIPKQKFARCSRDAFLGTCWQPSLAAALRARHQSPHS